MPQNQPRVILGSSSPQRLELLSLLVPRKDIEVIPPRNAEEKGFDDCTTKNDVKNRTLEILTSKALDVMQQIDDRDALVICADTVIAGRNSDGALKVFGKPPQKDNWPDVVREWFREYYFVNKHWALTAVRGLAGSGSYCWLVETEILFNRSAEDMLDWYISTGEPIGKAGGYGLQGAGSLFVESIDGSPSNVIGLPLHETAELLRKCGYEF